MTAPLFKGVITALITPLRDGNVDEAAFEALLERQIAAGVHGVVPVGTTGESATLTTEEHKALVERTVALARGRVRVIAGAGASATGKAIELVRHAKTVGADGALAFKLPALAPGAAASVTLVFGMGEGSAAALAAVERGRAAGFDALAAADERRWGAWLRRAPSMPADAREAAVFRRALVVLKQLQADTGGMLAAPATLSPAYSYVWLQDLAADVRAFTACGYYQEARAALGFVASVQKPDGDWWVTYRGDGRPFKLWDHGSEWMGGHWLGAVGAYFAATGDRAAVRAWWPQIRKACGFMVAQIGPDGLIGPCVDLWETYRDQSWTYTNGTFVGGLEASAAIARSLGEDTDAAAWQAAAGRIRSALRTRAIARPGGWFGKGVRPGSPIADPAIDASVLGLAWPNGVVSADDPAMQATVARVRARLLQPGGGVQRWQGDGWYGGQGWVELTDWLALVAHRGGDAALASRLHTANVERAYSTGSLQLGEVFDERTGTFTSAFPLGWPEAQFVLTSLALRGVLP
jgi:GH15 family glucan-1,4-alpha-glucosidase